MPEIPISPPFRGSDELAPNQGCVELIDGFCDQIAQNKYALFRRGGLWPYWWSGLQDQIDGLYWWKEKQKLIVVCGGRIFVFSNMTDAPTEITTTTCTVNALKSVSFASSGRWLCIVTQTGKPVIWSGTGNVEYLAESPYMESVCYIADKFVFNESGTNQVRYATAVVNQTDKPEYQVGRFFSPDGNPDSLVAVSSKFGELMLSGPDSTEFWIYDPSKQDPEVPFSPVPGSYNEHGIVAPASLTFFNDSFYWLSDTKQVMKLTGRTVDIISSPLDRTFKAMTTVANARGFMVDNRFYCLAFPTDDFCLVFDTFIGAWYKWSYWTGSTYERFLGNCSAWVPEWNTQFIGSRTNGRLLIYSKALVTDLGDPLRALYRTAHMDWGNLDVKQSDKLTMRLRRGV